MQLATLRSPSLFLVLALLAPCPGLSDFAVVGADGAIHKLQQGPYSELFPDSHEIDGDSLVLALDVVHQGHVERSLVPGTEDSYAERPAALHYERKSNATYVLWEGLVNGLHPFLHLAAFDGQMWSGPIDITGNVFADKAGAELVILSEPEINKATQLLEASLDRSIMYVAWQEVSPAGVQNYLVPIILQGGVYLGWHESLRLSSFVPADPGQRSPVVDSNVENLLRIQPSTKNSAVVVGFTDPDTGRMVVLELEMLPQALSTLAARVEDLIQQYAETSSSVEELGAEIRRAMMQYSGSFHLGVLDYLADQIEALLQDYSSVAAAVAPGIPEKLGGTIIHVGARVRSKGLIDTEPRQIIQVGQTREGGAPYHHLKVSVLADRETPQVGGPAVLFLSSTGLEALVAWEEEEGIAFRETEGADWGEREVVGLSGDLTKQDIYRILADRTLNR